MKIVFIRFAKAILLGLSLSCFAGQASATGGVLDTFASRGTVTPTATMYGGFTIVDASILYIAVRGPSLGTLGATQNPLDLPNLRVYDASGIDVLSNPSGGVAASGCPSTGTSSGVTVSDYYTSVRGQSLDVRDTCVSVALAAGVYTFTITPNSPSQSGEVLFEVTVNPATPTPTPTPTLTWSLYTNYCSACHGTSQRTASPSQVREAINDNKGGGAYGMGMLNLSSCTACHPGTGRVTVTDSLIADILSGN